MNNWINAADALPKPGQTVTIKGGQTGIYQGLVNQNCPFEWWFTQNKKGPDRIKRVNFWMPDEEAAKWKTRG